jgi:hypothetical protein
MDSPNRLQDPISSALLFAVMAVASTWLLAFAYKNTKIALKHKVMD